MFRLLRPKQVKSEKSDSATNTCTSAQQQTPGRGFCWRPGRKQYQDVNSNGILDSHEKWFLTARVLVLSWSLVLMTASYFGNEEIDRTFVGAAFTASIASFGMKRLPK